MPINSFKNDEATTEVSKMTTLLRLFRYLLAYKKEIIGVLIIMGLCVTVTLINPLLIEEAIDNYITNKNLTGLLKLGAFATLAQLATLVVCNDSGVSHLAAAAGGRVVSVLGPDGAAMWHVQGEHVTILRPEQGWPSLASVLSAVNTRPPQ